MTLTEATVASLGLEDEAHAFLLKYYPDALPERRHEHVYTVRHHPDYEPQTYLELVTRKMHEQGVYRRSPEYRRRFLEVACFTSPLPDYPTHEVGSCPGCTQRWRTEHGLSADVRDVEKRYKEERRGS